MGLHLQMRDANAALVGVPLYTLSRYPDPDRLRGPPSQVGPGHLRGLAATNSTVASRRDTTSRRPTRGRFGAMRTVNWKWRFWSIPLGSLVGRVLRWLRRWRRRTQGGENHPRRYARRGSWNGVYFNPQYGNLHLVETGGSSPASGRRPTARLGRAQRTGDGNVFHFEWTEHKSVSSARPRRARARAISSTSARRATTSTTTLEGEWGLNSNETGNEWDCVKQRHVTPDLKSIGGVARARRRPSKDWK